jgi:hypothetical protein
MSTRRPARWRRFFFDTHELGCTRELAAGLLLDSWAELSDSVFFSSWNFDESPDELEPDDDSTDDDEFELQLHSERDDDHTWTEDCGIEGDEFIDQISSPVAFVFLFQTSIANSIVHSISI